MKKRHFFILFSFFCLRIFAQEQTPVTLYEIMMLDGTTYKGYIERQTDTVVILKSSAGVIVHIPRKSIALVETLKAEARGDSTGMRIHMPSISQYYYTTTSNAFLFRKGEFFGSDSWLAFFSLNYAPTKHLSVGIVTSVIGVPMGIHMKYNVEVAHKLYLGLEGVGGSLLYLNPKTKGYGGLFKLTHGDSRMNFTVYGGYFEADQWINPRRGNRNRPGRPGNYYQYYRSSFAGLAFSLPLTQKSNFVGDVFAFPFVSIYTGSFGIRRVARQNISFVYGFQFIKNVFPLVNRVFTVPYVGFAFRL